jgi:hypothetical protein
MVVNFNSQKKIVPESKKKLLHKSNSLINFSNKNYARIKIEAAGCRVPVSSYRLSVSGGRQNVVSLLQ